MSKDSNIIPLPAYFERYRELFSKLDREHIPCHAAIIMDGNGRWARQRGLVRYRGHEHAMKSVRESVRASAELGLKALSLFAFSTENWKRPKEEVAFLLRLFDRTLANELDELCGNNVRFMCSGDRQKLPDWLNKTIDRAGEMLAKNTGLILNLAVNYGGKQDILQAVNKLLKGGARSAQREITETEFEKALFTGNLPPVDLMIRTSGEQRISNFFLWQAAYAELIFLDVLWPDFRRQHLLEAVIEYQNRDRRFGAI
ncbi:MAG: di-trans,poly-cis-decaprenylcistransferase [Elusimicrobia bacterium]|nr:di-trans,poly-cis-decaprenylcistransferase [Elusimicrobiota bacterium]